MRPVWPVEPVRAEGSVGQAGLASSAFPSAGKKEAAPTSLLITQLNQEMKRPLPGL